MRLDEVTSGEVYVDVNVFYMYLRPDPAHIRTIRVFLDRMVHGDVEVYTSILTMDELFYRLLLARVKDAYGRNPLDVLREETAEAIARCGSEVEAALRKLVQLPQLHLVGAIEEDFIQMLENINAFGLLPRDALHVATVRRLGLSDIATDDAGFDRVAWLRRHWLFNAPDQES